MKGAGKMKRREGERERTAKGEKGWRMVESSRRDSRSFPDVSSFFLLSNSNRASRLPRLNASSIDLKNEACRLFCELRFEKERYHHRRGRESSQPLSWIGLRSSSLTPRRPSSRSIRRLFQRRPTTSNRTRLVLVLLLDKQSSSSSSLEE